MKIITLLFIILILGCTSNQIFEHKIDSNHELNDGGILVFKDNTAFGMINGEGEDLLVGDFKAGNFSVIARALYRFNISDWNQTNIIFHLLCTGVYGTPGIIEAYLVNDFGKLPLRPSQPLDVNTTWNLINEGTLINQLTPEVGEWFTINIPASIIKNSELALVIKLSNESLNDGNYYAFHSYERGESRNQQKPYLTYEEI